MSKYEDARIVYFTEDFSKTTKSGEVRVFYKKNSTHAIHKTIVDKLQKAGAKMKVEKLDHKKAEEQLKAKIAKHKKHAVELSYE